MKAAIVERGPRQRTRTDDVGPEAADAAAPQPERRQHGRRHQRRECDNGQWPRWIEHRQDQQAQRIISNREEQQEWDGRMPRRGR